MNINMSSAHYDILRDVAQCQANVVMFQETQNWRGDGAAEEIGGNWVCAGTEAKTHESSETLQNDYEMGPGHAGEYVTHDALLASDVER